MVGAGSSCSWSLSSVSGSSSDSEEITSSCHRFATFSYANASSSFALAYRPKSNMPKLFSRGLFANGSCCSSNCVSLVLTRLWTTSDDGSLLSLQADSFRSLPGLRVMDCIAGIF